LFKLDHCLINHRQGYFVVQRLVAVIGQLNRKQVCPYEIIILF